MNRNRILSTSFVTASTLALAICSTLQALADPQSVESVNNNANSIALLNIIANLGEIGGIALGLPVTCGGIILLFFRGKRKLAGLVIAGGIFVVIAAIALPGVINWLTASFLESSKSR